MPRGEQAVVPPAEVRTYYDRPVLKEPTWRWYIPAYFWAGGMAAGSSMVAAAADASGDHGLARRSRGVALGAVGFGAACLVADLGRPERFHHMLRVAKPTSPMSVGTWLLTLYGPAAGVAAATDVLGILPGAKRMATWAAAGLAPLIASYTAVLLTDTAVPVWHEATSTLPAAFVTSAAAAAGGAALVAGAVTGAEPASAAVRLAVGGTIAEAVAARVMHHRLTPVVAAAYRSPAPRAWSAGAAVLGVVGAALTIAARRSRFAVGAAGLMIALGSACERFAVVEAGKASARDPRATTLPQRARALTVGGYPTGTRDADEIHR